MSRPKVISNKWWINALNIQKYYRHFISFIYYIIKKITRKRNSINLPLSVIIQKVKLRRYLRIQNTLKRKRSRIEKNCRNTVMHFEIIAVEAMALSLLPVIRLYKTSRKINSCTNIIY